MFDPSAMAAVSVALQAFGQLIGKVNDQSIREEFREKLGELQDKIAALRLDYDSALTENFELKRKLEAQEAQAFLKKALHFRNGLYWLGDEPTPYCPVCWDNDSKAVHVYNEGDYWRCHFHLTLQVQKISVPWS